MKKQIFLFLALIFAASAFAQRRFTALLDTNKILIGEQTTLHLKAENLSSPNDLMWPMWPDTLKKVEVISTSRDTVENDGKFSITEHFVLTSFDSGFVVIPPFTLLLEDERLETEPQILNVGMVEILADQDLYDIKAPVDPPFDFLYWLKKLWLIWLILVLAIAIIIYLIHRKKKAKATVAKVLDLRSPAQRARENLAAIREAKIWQSGDVKGYYSQVSDCIRTYLEEEFKTPAMEMVSDELLDAMQTKISANAQQLLRNILRPADMVKFAKTKPGPEMHTKMWDDALEIISLTETKMQANVE